MYRKACSCQGFDMFCEQNISSKSSSLSKSDSDTDENDHDSDHSGNTVQITSRQKGTRAKEEEEGEIEEQNHAEEDDDVIFIEEINSVCTKEKEESTTQRNRSRYRNQSTKWPSSSVKRNLRTPLPFKSCKKKQIQFQRTLKLVEAQETNIFSQTRRKIRAKRKLKSCRKSLRSKSDYNSYRRLARDLLQRKFDQRIKELSLCNMYTPAYVRSIVAKYEQAVHEMYSTNYVKYKRRIQAISSNLLANVCVNENSDFSFFKKLIDQKIEPRKLASMNIEEMAGEALQLQRALDRTKDLHERVKFANNLQTSASKFIKKTHKGIVDIDINIVEGAFAENESKSPEYEMLSSDDDENVDKKKEEEDDVVFISSGSSRSASASSNYEIISLGDDENEQNNNRVQHVKIKPISYLFETKRDVGVRLFILNVLIHMVGV